MLHAEISRQKTKYTLETTNEILELPPLSPQTISKYFYYHKINSLELKLNEEFYCEDKHEEIHFENVWIFDADDTLWEDNFYFEQLKKIFIKHMISQDPSLNAKRISKEIEAVEAQVITEMGFGPIGFKESLKRTCENFSGPNKKIPLPVEFLDAIISILTHLPLEIPEQTKQTLAALKEAGHGLVLYTRGHAEIQFPKIARSGLGEYFHAVSITKNKTATELKRLIQQQITFTSKNFFYVGNSLKSDIEPAVECGITAYYYNNPNTWEYEHKADVPSTSYISIKALTDLLSLC